MKALRLKIDKDEVNKDNYLVIIGGFIHGEDFSYLLESVEKELKPVFIALKEEFENNYQDLYGQDMNEIVWKLDDGRMVGLTWRAWADFRAAFENEKNITSGKKKRYDYTDFYMRGWHDE